MNICFILVLSSFIQLAFNAIIKILFPGALDVTWFIYLQLGLNSILSIFIPAYLYLKWEEKSYFTDWVKDVKISWLIPLSLAIGVCLQFVGGLVNLPINTAIFQLKGELIDKLPQISYFGDYIVAIIVLCIFPAVFEETLFRGIILNYFREYGDKVAIVISAMLFSIMHFSLENLLGTFVLGLVFGLMIKHTNRIIYPMIAHFTVNFLATTIKYAMNSELFATFYSDYIMIFMILSLPILIYLVNLFGKLATPNPYCDYEKHNNTKENFIKLNEESTIRIIEHDEKENNFKMAFKNMFKSPFIYIILALFVLIGGQVIWGK